MMHDQYIALAVILSTPKDNNILSACRMRLKMKVVIESRVSDLSGLVTVSSLNCRRPPFRGAGACRYKQC